MLQIYGLNLEAIVTITFNDIPKLLCLSWVTLIQEHLWAKHTGIFITPTCPRTLRTWQKSGNFSSHFEVWPC